MPVGNAEFSAKSKDNSEAILTTYMELLVSVVSISYYLCQ